MGNGDPKLSGIERRRQGMAAEKVRTDEEGWRLLSKERQIALWSKHEDIAMHFNDLAVRLRIQALGGIGAASLIAGGIVTHQAQIELRFLGVFLMAMAVIWASVWLLDKFYYQALLVGAVKHIKEVESWTPGVKMSTRIEEVVSPAGQNSRGAFYAVVFVLLAGGGGALYVWGPEWAPPTKTEPACVKLCASALASAVASATAAAASAAPSSVPASPATAAPSPTISPSVSAQPPATAGP